MLAARLARTASPVVDRRVVVRRRVAARDACARRSIPAVGAALRHLADARRGVPAERRSLVLLAHRRQSDCACARRIPHVSQRRASGRIHGDDAAREDDLPLEYPDTWRKASPGRRCPLARGAIFETRAARSVSERRAVRRQHSRRRCREPSVFRQTARSSEPWRVADARRHSAAPGKPRRTDGVRREPPHGARAARAHVAGTPRQRFRRSPAARSADRGSSAVLDAVAGASSGRSRVGEPRSSGRAHRHYD